MKWLPVNKERIKAEGTQTDLSEFTLRCRFEFGIMLNTYKK